jgi:signal peptidase I
MMSNEHGKPDWATGAQGAGEPADGVSAHGNHGYSALTDGPVPGADEAWSGAGGFSASTVGLPAGQQTREFETWPTAAGAGTGVPAGTGTGAPAGAGAGVPGPPPEPGDDQSAAPGEPGQEDEAPASKPRRFSGWRELPILIVVALAIALVIKSFVVQPFYIPSSSMEDTLLIGDKVLVNKLVYHFRSIQPGDIIVFNGDGSWNPNPPAAGSGSNVIARAYDDTLGALFHSIAGLFGTPIGQTDYIKRVIGTPGDHVVCCNAQGLVTVNGVPLHEQSYLFPGAAPSQIKFNIVVPPGRLWVMGDNRAVSDDSRLRMSDPGDGTIPENKVIGRAFVIVWPPSRWRILPIPSTFSQPGISAGSSAAGRSADRATAASAASAAEQKAVTQLLGARVAPEPSYLPLAAGVIGAVPLTWLQLLVRRRIQRRRRRKPGPTGSVRQERDRLRWLRPHRHS